MELAVTPRYLHRLSHQGQQTPALRLSRLGSPPPAGPMTCRRACTFHVAFARRRITIVGKSPCSLFQDNTITTTTTHSQIWYADRKLRHSRGRNLTNARANARAPPSPQARKRYAMVACAIMNISLTQPQRDGLDTKFKCVFCNSEDSISTKIDKKAGVASLSCKNCVQSYQMSANCMPRLLYVPYFLHGACD
jgi:hypothetical protein